MIERTWSVGRRAAVLLIDFNGSGRALTPYFDTDYFDFRFGDESRGERRIDGQYWTSTEYVGTTFRGDASDPPRGPSAPQARR